MKIPELEIIKEFETEFQCKDILIYKNYFIIRSSLILIYNSDNYQLFKQNDLQGIDFLTQLSNDFNFLIIKKL